MLGNVDKGDVGAFVLSPLADRGMLLKKSLVHLLNVGVGDCVG